jgi:hypothetical protein
VLTFAGTGTARPLSLVSARIWHDQAFQAAFESPRAMERHDWASGSRDCGRADQICTHTGGTITRQSAAPNGRSVRRAVVITDHAA